MSTEVCFFYCLFGVFLVFLPKGEISEKCTIAKVLCLEQKLLLSFFLFATLQKLYLFQVLKPYENKLDGY